MINLMLAQAQLALIQVRNELTAKPELLNDAEHWITVNGGEHAETGEKTGKHILINGEGEVIGGAGGALNGKKLEHVKSKSGDVEKPKEQKSGLSAEQKKNFEDNINHSLSVLSLDGENLHKTPYVTSINKTINRLDELGHKDFAESLRKMVTDNGQESILDGFEQQPKEKEPTSPIDMQAEKFQPTHELSDGEPVKHIDGNVYADKDGNEYEDDYAVKLDAKPEDKKLENKEPETTPEPKTEDKKADRGYTYGDVYKMADGRLVTMHGGTMGSDRVRAHDVNTGDFINYANRDELEPYSLKENYNGEVAQEQGEPSGENKGQQENKRQNQSNDDDLNPNSPNYRYRDTGEIAGSSKEKAATRIKNAAKSGERLNATDIDWQDVEQNPREAKTLITKANLFGSVDWNALKSTNMEPGAGFLIDKVYKSIAKEAGDSEQQRKDYALGLQTIRDRMEQCKTPDDVMKTLSEIRDEREGKMISADNQAEYLKVQSELDKVAKDYKELVKADLIAKPGGGFTEQALEVNKRRKEANDAMRRIQEKNILENPTARAWSALGDKFDSIVKGGNRSVQYPDYKSGSSSFLSHAINAKDGDVKDWSWAEKDKRTGTSEGKKKEKPFQLLVADKITRKGGKQITVDSTKALKELVGLRDVQSGNWVLKDKESAIFHVQKSAEAFSDLSDVLGVPLNKIALNGRLAMAFGARGHGNALAHYEPVQRVINLTKMKGGGSLAHEWLHSLDNMISEMETGKTGGAGDWSSENPNLLPEGKLKSAVVGLRSAMLTGNTPKKEAIQYTSKDISIGKYNFDGATYGLSKEIKDAGSLDKAIEAINKKFSGMVNPKTLKAAEKWRKITAAYYDNNPDGGVAHIATGEVHSMFADGALRLDKGKSGKYWSQPKEMMARAFEAYVTDKLKEQGRENTYLSAHADNDDYHSMGDYDPYPVGAERRHINAAFDQFFEAIREGIMPQLMSDSLDWLTVSNK